MVCAPITRLQCCAPTCGAAAVILGSWEFAQKRGLTARAPAVRAISLMTDLSSTFESGSAMALMGSGESRRASEAVYEASGLGVADCQLIELHDSFAINAVVSMEALGLAEAGETERLIQDGDHTYGGRWVVNPSGGLISKGHPLGATGVAQVVELVQQLRGEAGPRQVPRARAGLAHNQGIGGATVVSLLTTD
jgi:acetyl-CoA acyltransferase